MCHKDERLYICQPDGFTAFRMTREATDTELKLIGFERVVFKTVMVRPYVCPINGAEFGDTPYPMRLPHRPDGTRLKFG